MPNTNKEYEKHQLRYLKFIQTLSEKFKDKRGMINIYTKVVNNKINT